VLLESLRQRLSHFSGAENSDRVHDEILKALQVVTLILITEGNHRDATQVPDSASGPLRDG
jgi:hypothetical protein